MKISVVIPNFNGKVLLEKNLPILFKSVDNFKNNICEVIIVDNGSTDGSVSYLKSNFSAKCKIIKLSKNRGLCAAVNIGVRSTRGDLILLLSNDMVVKENFLENIKELLNDPKVFALTLSENRNKMLFNDGIVDIYSVPSKKIKSDQTFYLSDEAVLFKKTIWQELGGFDEKLLSPSSWENIDLCYRASKRGYSVLSGGEGKTVSKRKHISKIEERNKLLVIWKNIHSKPLITKHINYLIRTILKKPSYLIILIMAFSRFPQLLKSRKKEIKESKVSDEAVFQKYS